MEIDESEKLADFKKEFFNHAKKSPLYKNIEKTNGHIVFGRGNDSPKIVFIGEAPGQNENISGTPFIGRSGKLLDEWTDKLELKNEFAIINVVPIIPLNKENGIRPPTEEEINYFLPLTEKYLELLNPKVIILLGRRAASIFDKNLHVGEIKHWKKMKLFFIYHPSYYLRQGGKGYENTLLKLKDFLSNKGTQEKLV